MRKVAAGLTVRELIEQLNKIENKDKYIELLCNNNHEINYGFITHIDERAEIVTLESN